ncbi:unnamed protein product [Dovyalis caffra]|uniref:Uncharacterized protein n=1 Tax=Dovyalis caffra TaxID=77055 RepID=A0AAV1RH32_9ROSI|nr:unnamed protein product [Dovyalis caffra]
MSPRKCKITQINDPDTTEQQELPPIMFNSDLELPPQTGITKKDSPLPFSRLTQEVKISPSKARAQTPIFSRPS